MDDAVHPVNDGAGSQEHQGFKECVGHHMENGGNVAADTNGKEHVPQLADRRISEHAFDVVLRRGDRRREQRRERAHPGDDGHDRGRKLEQRMHSDHEVHPGGDHGGGVDQGRDRRGTLHGIGQPHIER